MMPHMRFPTKRQAMKKRQKDWRRNMIRQAQEWRDIRDVFEQLTLVDSARIERRVGRAIVRLKNEGHVGTVFDSIYFAYKYAKEITDTICV